LISFTHNFHWPRGNWTTPDGALIATVVPGLGAEVRRDLVQHANHYLTKCYQWGTIDKFGVLSLGAYDRIFYFSAPESSINGSRGADVTCNVQFVKDKKYAYVRLTGFGVSGEANEGRT
jgi:hypothetical protein